MQKDREKWNTKYKNIDYKRSVADPLQRFSFLWESLEPKPGHNLRALDLACGTGQNSLHLAEKGFHVDAMDISDVALNLFSHPNITKFKVDFDTHRILENQYDLILDFYFLERRLFPNMVSSLKPGGILMIETFLETREAPSNPDHKLKSQELLGAFNSLRILYYYETEEKATLIAKNTYQTTQEISS